MQMDAAGLKAASLNNFFIIFFMCYIFIIIDNIIHLFSETSQQHMKTDQVHFSCTAATC